MDGLILATVLAGVILMAMGFLRLGNLIKYIPYTITTGFTAGIAVTIAIGQVKDFLGLAYPEGTVTIETMEKLEAVIKNISTINVQALAVGLVCLAILIIWPYVNKTVPGSLIAVIAGILMVKLLGMKVNTIGDLYEISNKLPSLRLPSFTWKEVGDILPDAFTIAILAAIESLLSCVVSDSMINSRHRSNMELIAQGVGNIGSALRRHPRHRRNRENRCQHQERRTHPHCRYGALRHAGADSGHFDALRGADSHALHCRHPVYGGIQYERLAFLFASVQILSQERCCGAGLKLCAYGCL